MYDFDQQGVRLRTTCFATPLNPRIFWVTTLFQLEMFLWELVFAHRRTAPWSCAPSHCCEPYGFKTVLQLFSSKLMAFNVHGSLGLMLACWAVEYTLQIGTKALNIFSYKWLSTHEQTIYFSKVFKILRHFKQPLYAHCWSGECLCLNFQCVIDDCRLWGRYMKQQSTASSWQKYYSFQLLSYVTFSRRRLRGLTL